MLYLLLLLLLLTLFFGPQLWLKLTMKQYATPRDDIPGTGGELALHLINHLGLEGVGVEQTDKGDHYNPQTKMVALGHQTFNQKSIASVAIAAHEIGHAIQHALDEPGLRWRTRLAIFAFYAEKSGAAIMMFIPIITAISHAPVIAYLSFIIGFLVLASSALVHLITFPVEWDASFHKAYPILVEGGYIKPADHKTVKKILFAAAMTYVAASLASLLNVWRWFKILKPR